MIKINHRFSIERDEFCWKLFEFRASKSRKSKNGKKSGKPIVTSKVSYYGNLTQICDEILDRSLGTCTSLEGIRETIALARDGILKTVKRKVKRGLK